jgi:nicotinamidase-related amidase
MKTALLLVDIQNDYFPGGRMELQGSLPAGEQAGRLLGWFRHYAWPVVFIQHIALRPGATFFLPDTPGAEIHPLVQPLPSEPVFQKHFPNSFRETLLLNHLHDQGIERLVIAGMMTHMCLDAAVRAACDHGFRCLVAGPACATKDLTFAAQTIPAAAVQGAFLAALNGTYGQVLSVDEILSELKNTILNHSTA